MERALAMISHHARRTKNPMSRAVRTPADRNRSSEAVRLDDGRPSGREQAPTQLTTSGVLEPSVCDVSAVEARAWCAPELLFVSPRSGLLEPSRSSITRSMGILPLRQLM